MAKKRITEEQRAYIIAHKDDRPRAKVAEALGLSVCTVTRIAIANGGNRLRRKIQGIEEIIRQYYPTMGSAEIAAKTGIKTATICQWAKKLKIKHTAETAERLKAKKREHMREIARTCIDKRIKTWKVRRRIDELRIMQGQPQQTAHKFKELSSRAYSARQRLIKNRLYIKSDEDPYTLLYDNRTKRHEASSRHPEAYYEKAYHFRFMPSEAHQFEKAEREAIEEAISKTAAGSARGLQIAVRHHQCGGLLLEVEERVTNPSDDDEEYSTRHTLHLPCWDIEEEIAKACAFTSRILAGAAARKMVRMRTKYVE